MTRVFGPDDWGLFWTLEPTQQDITNLQASGVGTVMLTRQLAHDKPQVVALLKGLGKRLVIRSTPEDMADPSIRFGIPAWLRGLEDSGADVRAFIGWNEPDAGVDWRFEDDAGHAADWQREKCQQHAAEVRGFAAIWSGAGLKAKLVAPPWAVHAITEDDPPQPGEIMWREETLYGYVTCSGGCGNHWYAHNWDLAGAVLVNGVWQGGVNINFFRLKMRAEFQAGLHHVPIWVDEVGINDPHLPKIDKMHGYIEIAEWLMSPQQRKPGHIGTRVAFFCPFLANGGPEWSAFLLTPECYVLLGEAMKRWRAAGL